MLETWAARPEDMTSLDDNTFGGVGAVLPDCLKRPWYTWASPTIRRNSCRFLSADHQTL